MEYGRGIIPEERFHQHSLTSFLLTEERSFSRQWKKLPHVLQVPDHFFDDERVNHFRLQKKEYSEYFHVPPEWVSFSWRRPELEKAEEKLLSSLKKGRTFAVLSSALNHPTFFQWIREQNIPEFRVELNASGKINLSSFQEQLNSVLEKGFDLFFSFPLVHEEAGITQDLTPLAKVWRKFRKRAQEKGVDVSFHLDGGFEAFRKGMNFFSTHADILSFSLGLVSPFPFFTVIERGGGETSVPLRFRELGLSFALTFLEHRERFWKVGEGKEKYIRQMWRECGLPEEAILSEIPFLFAFRLPLVNHEELSIRLAQHSLPLWFSTSCKYFQRRSPLLVGMGEHTEDFAYFFYHPKTDSSYLQKYICALAEQGAKIQQTKKRFS